jgi:hypothetical protein
MYADVIEPPPPPLILLFYQVEIRLTNPFIEILNPLKAAYARYSTTRLWQLQGR